MEWDLFLLDVRTKEAAYREVSLEEKLAVIVKDESRRPGHLQMMEVPEGKKNPDSPQRGRSWEQSTPLRLPWTVGRPLVGMREDGPNGLQTLVNSEKRDRPGGLLESIEELEEQSVSSIESQEISVKCPVCRGARWWRRES